MNLFEIVVYFLRKSFKVKFGVILSFNFIIKKDINSVIPFQRG